MLLAIISWQAWLTIAVFVGVLYFLVREHFAPDITMLGGASILVVSGIITPQQFLFGFSRPIIFALAMLCVVARAIYTAGLLDWLARVALPHGGSYRGRLAKLMLPISGFSAFLNNTPIVLMVISVVRKWALDAKHSPSRYLIPVSFAAIFGGMCTLIGTAGNLVVDGLLEEIDPSAGFAFFELGIVGLPCLVVAYLYMLTIGGSLLPDRKEPGAMAEAQRREFTGEFDVGEECPLAGKSVLEAARRYFPEGYILEIIRGPTVFDSPGPDRVIEIGDRLVFAGDMTQIANLHTVEGLTSVADPSFKIDVSSPHFAEVVIAINSWMVGKTLRRVRFRSRYGASVVAIYRNGQRVVGNVGEIALHAGDTLILLSNVPWRGERRLSGDLYSIAQSEELPLFSPGRAWWVGAVLIAMVVAVTLGLPILIGSLAAAALLLITRSVSIRQAIIGIDWHLLLLVASAFALGQALYSTGVASLLATGVMAVVGSNPYLMIGGIFLLTMIVTELITNTAAALMIFPIAVETARLAGYDSLGAVKAVGVTVAIAASSSFLTPIGYQTNTIVYGPGGYRFGDYARVGWPLTVTQLLIASAIIPNVWL